jgi:hypothetical protein
MKRVMDKLQIYIICDDISILHQINTDGVQLIENSLEVKNDKFYIKAIIESHIIKSIKTICDIEIIENVEFEA